jgi:hypothetical protein
MRALLVGCMLLGSTAVTLAEPIRVGDAVQVRPNSIWFQDAATLAKWQRLRKARRAQVLDARALAGFERRVLHARDAWRFVNPLAVKIVGRSETAHRVTVKMTTEGRMKGSVWMLDDSALLR